MSSDLFKSIRVTKLGHGHLKREEALRIAERYVEKNREKVHRATLVGSLMRGHRWVKDIDLVVIPQGHLDDSLPMNLFRCDENTWESYILHYAPGKAIIQIKSHAIRCGYHLSSKGLFTRTARKELVTTRAEEICGILDVPLPEPVRLSLVGVGRLA